MALYTKTYKIEILISDSLYYDPYPNRKVADLIEVDLEKIERIIENELEADFDDEIDVHADLTKMTIEMRILKDNAYFESWETFAFRPKGISIAKKYHLRFVETI